MNYAEFATDISRNASEALLIMAAAGTFMAALRWNIALRRDFLLAFIVVLLGTSLAQVPVYLGGMVGWGPDLILFSGIARWTQVVGAMLYVRAALGEHCGPWGWRFVVLAVAFWTWVI